MRVGRSLPVLTKTGIAQPFRISRFGVKDSICSWCSQGRYDMQRRPYQNFGIFGTARHWPTGELSLKLLIDFKIGFEFLLYFGPRGIWLCNCLFRFQPWLQQLLEKTPKSPCWISKMSPRVSSANHKNCDSLAFLDFDAIYQIKIRLRLMIYWIHTVIYVC